MFRPIALLQLLSLVFGFLSLFIAYLYPFHLPPYKTFFNELFFAAAILFLFIYINLFGEIRMARPEPWLFVLFVVFFHSYLFFKVGRVEYELMLWFFLYLVVSYFSYSLGLNFLAGGRVLSALIGLLVVVAMISVLVAILQWRGQLTGEGWHQGFFLAFKDASRFNSNIGQANNFGTLLVVGIWGVYYLGWKIGLLRIWSRVVACGCIVFLCFGLYLSGSRVAFLNLMVAPIVVLIWSSWKRRSFKYELLFPILILYGFEQLVPFVSSLFGADYLTGRELTADSQRLRLWRMAFEAIQDNPWVGYGFGGVSKVHLIYSDEYGAFDYSIATHAHNTILDLWLEFGVLTGSVVVLFFGSIVFFSFCKSKNILDLSLILMVFAVLLHSMVEYPLHYGFFLWLVFFLLGVVCAQFQFASIRFRARVSSSLLQFFGLISIFIIWSAYLSVEALYTKGRSSGVSVSEIEVVESGWVGGIFPGSLATLRTSIMPIVSDISNEKIDELHDIASLRPFPVLLWKMAVVNSYRGDRLQAIWWLERICRMFPPDCDNAERSWNQIFGNDPVMKKVPWDYWKDSAVSGVGLSPDR